MTTKSVAIAGNMLVDSVKRIETYPSCGMLSTITNVEQSVGGCVPNTLLNLHTIDASIPLTPIGCVGDDENGRFVLNRFKLAGIDAGFIQVLSGCATSFSDAMLAMDSGERTFFHYRGANAEFMPEHIPLKKLSGGLLHIGYLLLLDRFDQPDSAYGTAMARFLHDAQRLGVETSIDVVSDSNGAFARTVPPALRYCDYAIMNEIEGCMIFGLSARDANGRLQRDHIAAALEGMISKGVRKRAVIHCPEAGFCMERDGKLTVAPAFLLPKSYIKGSVGAGDAFCAGCLYAIRNEMNAADMLRFGAAAACANLSEADAVSGMKDAAELRRMIQTWEIRSDSSF